MRENARSKSNSEKNSGCEKLNTYMYVRMYVVCVRAAWLAADTVRERVRATICITFVRQNRVAR